MRNLQHRAKTVRTTAPSIARLIATWKTMSQTCLDIANPCDVCGAIVTTTPWLWKDAWPTLEPLCLCSECNGKARKWEAYITTTNGQRAVYPTAPVTVALGVAAFPAPPKKLRCNCTLTTQFGPLMYEQAAEGRSTLLQCTHCGVWWIDSGEVHFAIGMMIALGVVYSQRKGS